MTIRRTPRDFRVEEVLDPAAGRIMARRPGGRTFLAYRLEKESITTPEACAFLARALSVKAGGVAWCGLKDRHAVTSQVVTAPAETGDAEPPAEISGERWRAVFMGFAPEPACAAWIGANRFTIIVRGLSGGAAGEMERRASLLRDGDGLLIVNYFGDQRFGSARHGEGFAARALIRGDFERALRLLVGTPARKDSGARRTLTRLCAAHWGDWAAIMAHAPRCPERRAVETLAAGGGFREAFAALPNLVQVMAVEAYQSHLWNATVRRLVERGVVSEKMLHADDGFGVMLFPAAAGVPPAWRSLGVPLLGPESRLEGEWGTAAGEVLKEEGIAVESLRVPGLRRPEFGEAWRPLLVRAAGFEIGPIEKDDLARVRSPRGLKRCVRFELARGAYATVVLRALGQ